MKIKFLGIYNTKSKTTGPVSFILDDVLAVDAGSLATGLTLEEQLDIKAILLSHGHYDHIADIPSYFFNNSDRITTVYGSRQTFNILSTHLVDGAIYPNFYQPSDFLKKASMEFVELQSYSVISIGNFSVLPVPMEHTLEEFGFEITGQGNSKVFYSGDTGASISKAWQYINPDVLVIEVTLPDRLREWAERAMHLCPQTLREQLVEFRNLKGYVPKVIPVHISPRHENEIIAELKTASKEMGFELILASEGQTLEL